MPIEETLLAEPPCKTLPKLGHHLLSDDPMAKELLGCKSGKEEVYVILERAEKGPILELVSHY